MTQSFHPVLGEHQFLPEPVQRSFEENQILGGIVYKQDGHTTDAATDPEAGGTPSAPR